VKVKNVERGEGVFRLIVGVILIILAFFISGVSRWILGLVGGGSNPYSQIWILTMKRIHAEGLQQRTWKRLYCF
jgi:uncharacterized oligopeptide transporter (OPT) family protein